jgi:hypothetical protein
MTQGVTPTPPLWTLPLHCGYCGQAAAVDCEPAAGLREFWICPAIGCARENMLPNVHVLRARRRVSPEETI